MLDFQNIFLRIILDSAELDSYFSIDAFNDCITRTSIAIQTESNRTGVYKANPVNGKICRDMSMA